MADIFLSYSREDEGRIKGLVSEFEAQGWSVFWDRRIPAGETWRSHIGSGLQAARCIVVAWSKYSIESQWVVEEADEGKTRNVLVPVLLDRVQPPRGFREIQAADISDWHMGQTSERLTELIGDLQRLLGKQPKARREGQHPEQPIALERKDERPARSRSILCRRAVAVALLSLLAISAVGYFIFGSLHTDKKAVVPPPNQAQPERSPDVASPMGSWLIVAGSFGHADRPAAEQRRIALTVAGFDAAIIDSNGYPLLMPNLWVVAIGPFESRETAKAVLTSVKTTVPDAYVKQGR